MFRGPGSMIIAKEYHQRDKEKSKDKGNQNIYLTIPYPIPSLCLDYLLRLQFDLVQSNRLSGFIFAANLAGATLLWGARGPQIPPRSQPGNGSQREIFLQLIRLICSGTNGHAAFWLPPACRGNYSS